MIWSFSRGKTGDSLAASASKEYREFLRNGNKTHSVTDAIHRLPHGFYVLGDAAYACNNTLLTPFTGDIDDQKRTYNFFLSQQRITVERAFGVLVNEKT